MSFSRWSENCDVYTYEADEGLCCCGCRLLGQSFYTDEIKEFLDHLNSHKEAGHKVPEYLLKIFMQELAEELGKEEG